MGMKSSKNQPIGILGGMGPDASARLYQLMIDMARQKYGVKRNEEYPEIVLQSIPVPDLYLIPSGLRRRCLC
jgi:aspartate/glutamate racemase